MKHELQQWGGLALLACAIFLTVSRKPGDSGQARHEESAPADAAPRGLRESAERSRHDRGQGRVVDREELKHALLVALDSEDDAALAGYVVRHAGGDFPAVLQVVRSDAGFMPRRIQMEEALVRSWSAHDPDAAMHWAANLPEWERAETLGRVCRNAARVAPAKAMRALLGSREGEAVAGDAESVADTWAASDVDGLIRWATALPGGELRERMVAKAGEGGFVREDFGGLSHE
ncbi:hypothetical protein OKA04_12500 [Luteolibacter flavescens]|uniref:HEAT repeat domain-containing protein n=1 Tax=Luteolibacter flavescens TaxID=1859460 RepID=A0ABT3FPP8_9BACT|nr:hypothetical protein [Luteolibacter flavescens]MCW1885551.1 hypothetical protein [Luteolibacter flavescens]